MFWRGSSGGDYLRNGGRCPSNARVLKVKLAHRAKIVVVVVDWSPLRLSNTLLQDPKPERRERWILERFPINPKAVCCHHGCPGAVPPFFLHSQEVHQVCSANRKGRRRRDKTYGFEL